MTIDEYRHLLQDHDWTHERSDDQRAYLKGRREIKVLRKLQKELDPDWTVWNELCPPSFRR